MKYPVHQERMKHRCERMANLGILAKIPAALVLESKCNLTAYYGSYFRAGCVLLWEGFYFATHSIWWRLTYWFSDRIGWTHLIPLSGTPCAVRHGKECDGVNCNWDCIHDAIPLWYRRVTGIINYE